MALRNAPTRLMKNLDYGRGYRVNLLDLGAMGDAAKRIGSARGQALRELAVARAVDAVATQVQIVRRKPVTDWEQTLLAAAVWVLEQKHRRRKAAPMLGDLVQLLHNPTAGMQDAILTEEPKGEGPVADVRASADYIRSVLSALPV